MKLVVDASAYVEHLFRGPAADAIESLFRIDGVEIHSPELCDVEFASAIVNLLRRRMTSKEHIAIALSAYLELPIVRHSHRALLGRAIALHDNFSTYDAIYVALAEMLDATLVTVDARLARAVRKVTSVTVFAAAPHP